MKIKALSFFNLFFTLFFCNSVFGLDSPNHSVKAKILFNEIYDINISEGNYKVSAELLLSWDGDINPFLKKFRNNKLNKYIEIEGAENLEKIKKEKKRVVFISGHFNNFELMALQIEKSGINLCAIYRPLNNIFLNKFMERIRKKYICKNQIKKGIGGLKKLLSFKNKNLSTALMIDQRVSEGILSNFFNEKALTTTKKSLTLGQKMFTLLDPPSKIPQNHKSSFKDSKQNEK